MNDDNREQAIEDIEKGLLLNSAHLADPAGQAVSEGGGGEAEGWELAEEDLIKHASHGDERSDTVALTEASRPEPEGDDQTGVFGESDSAAHQD